MGGPVAAARLSLKTRLLLMMLSLLALSAGSLFALHLSSERRLLHQLREYTEELSTAIEIAQEQPGAAADPQQAVRAYADELRRLGVRDVSIADTTAQVQASTNPKVVGRRLLRREGGPHEFVVRGVLGEESGPHSTTTLSVPIVVNDRRVGYLLITRHLDDFSLLSRQALLDRLLGTLAVFGVGMLLSLAFSWGLSRPLLELGGAARRVATGDLAIRVPERGAPELVALARSFNAMVLSLQEKRVLEERLHFAERATALGRLASAVAHEVRNPLNAISLTIDHVRSRLAPEDAARRGEFDRLLGALRSELTRLNRLVGDFLAFGKPTALHERPCALAPLLEDVATLVEHMARDQGIRLTVCSQADLPETLADPELLRTCLLNVLINAVDAMPQGGAMSAGVRRASDADDAEFVVEVSDTGSGMTPEAIREALEPYFSTKEAGLGLGLPLTRKIVEDHGGRVEIESEPERGTRVRLCLPVRAPAGAATQVPR